MIKMFAYTLSMLLFFLSGYTLSEYDHSLNPKISVKDSYCRFGVTGKKKKVEVDMVFVSTNSEDKIQIAKQCREKI